MPRRPEALPFGHLVAATLGGLTFVASLLYFAVCYTGRYGVALDPAASSPAIVPLAVDASLFSLFALHHSIFARTRLKVALTGLVAPDLERSSYVWIASLLFIALCAYWQPIAGTVWRLDDAWRAVPLVAQALAGVATLMAARQLGFLYLAGITQVLERGRPAAIPTLDDSGLYRIVRHPIYLAWTVLVWSTPTMTGTRLAFAVLSCLYLFVAVPFEERDLHRVFGPAYAAYCRRVHWRILPLVF